ncbi:MAG: hypothetical protein KBS59_03060 [Clostridiales bacterium]|nr:hypothetical protein [Clostridiales bacterium]
MDNGIDFYARRTKCRRLRIIGHCAQCGNAIYSENGALSVIGTEELIHADCWEEFATEHMFEFVEEVPQSEE